MEALEQQLPLYLQILDPTADGPAEPEWLAVFSALQDLGVITVRPLLMAIATAENATAGMQEVLELVVRRIVVGNLGTGNVERRFGEAARKVASSGSWEAALAELRDLNPTKDEFAEQLRKRSLNRSTLLFMRRSILQKTITPERNGYLHLIRPRQASDWQDFPDGDFSYWGSTLGNTVLAQIERRPKGATDWDAFRGLLLPEALEGDGIQAEAQSNTWGVDAVEERGKELASEGAEVWFTSDDT